jgi:pimeloyl-ACP methyl ester carboxylesterase
MVRIKTQQAELEVETYGRRDDSPMLLIEGLGGQLISWNEKFVRSLAARNFFVIRFDNRDSGLSTKFVNKGNNEDKYTIENMADDASQLLDRLGVTQSHVVGVSMGGMIAQALTIRHPNQVMSLCSIMSTTGEKGVGMPHEQGYNVLSLKPPTTREEIIEYKVTTSKMISSPGYDFDEEYHRDLATREYERSYEPDGLIRQLMAILVSEDRTESLKQVSVPTAVIHGDSDPLVDVSGGIATSKAVKNSTLHILKGMGHDLPQPLWGEIIDIIAQNASRAQDNFS